MKTKGLEKLSVLVLIFSSVMMISGAFLIWYLNGDSLVYESGEQWTRFNFPDSTQVDISDVGNKVEGLIEIISSTNLATRSLVRVMLLMGSGVLFSSVVLARYVWRVK
jgi:hypothetical protein